MTSTARPDGPGSGHRPTFSWFGGQGRLLALAAAVLLVLWLARGVIGPFVVAAVLAYAFSPVVSAIQERTRLPRVVVVALCYVVVLGVLGLVAFLAAEKAGAELTRLSSGNHDVIFSALQKLFGDTIVVAGQAYKTRDVADSLRNALLGLVQTPGDAVGLAERGVDIALQTILTLILTFYLLLDGYRFRDFALGFLDASRRADAIRILGHIHVVLGRWLRGQLLLIALVAVVLYLILGPILHVPYALALACLSGVLEIIPIVGPLIAVALAGTVAFGARGADTAIAVIVVYTVLRQVEDQIVMPLVIGRAVHLHPVVTIFAVLVGLSVWGILGALLGVPVAAALNVTLHELYPEETAALAEASDAGRRRVRLTWPRGRGIAPPVAAVVSGPGHEAAVELPDQAVKVGGGASGGGSQVRRRAAPGSGGRAASKEG
jgi:predicted PurR-regulated permease PerM